MKKLILTTAALCLLMVGCNTAPGTTLPHTTAPSTTAPSITAPGTTATQPATTVPDTAPSFPYHTLPTPPATTEPTIPETTVPAGPVSFLVYIPNEAGDGFVTNGATMEMLIPDGVLLLLKISGIVNENVSVNAAQMQGSQLDLDLNQAFLDQLLTMGSSGEKMLVGSIVNTFLSAYGAETVMLTVDGKIIDSGHAIYDSPLSQFN